MSNLSLQRIMISVSLGQQDHMKRILRHKEWAEQSVDFSFYDLTDLKQNPTKKSKWTQPISASIVKCLNVHVKLNIQAYVQYGHKASRDSWVVINIYWVCFIWRPGWRRCQRHQIDEHSCSMFIYVANNGRC